MVDLRRKDEKVDIDRRTHPRLDFNCKATIRGINQVVLVTDISLGGFFFELNTKKKLKMGTLVDVSMRLPTEEQAIRFKAKFISQGERGIGCKFVGLSPENEEAIRFCFDTFKDTLPLRP
jgi:c-di-GMP-binding flagellar brake protein YcgR